MAQQHSIHAFVAGTHITSQGNTVTITTDDLKASAAAYNPELHEAPLVIGHPKGNAPAYGWIASFDVEGDNFFATAKQVNPDFAELNNSGAFKKRSMSFYHPENPQNPVNGVWYPRHLGFLGAQPPAIKGLDDVHFAEGGEMLTVEFGQFEDQVEAGLWRGLREWMLAKFGKEDADAAVPKWDVEMLEREANLPEPTNDTAASFSESKQSNKENDVSDDATNDLTAREAALKKREKKLRQREDQAHRADCATFAEALAQEGKLLPVLKDGMVDFMSSLNATTTIEFAEGDTTQQKTPLQWMKDYLQAQPKVVSFGELPNGDTTELDTSDANALARAATDFQESERDHGRKVSITDAVNHVTNQEGV